MSYDYSENILVQEGAGHLLDTQISDTFENCGLLGKTKASEFIAISGEKLIKKLEGNPSFFLL